jgi:hypothetical protein
MTDVAPAPFTQRRAEACAARVVRSLPSAVVAAVERNENGRDVTVSVVSACASVAAAAPAALALVRAAIDSKLVGVVGVAVVLRAFANALDAAGGDGDGDAGKLTAVVSADDAAALGKLARGLASMCDEAGEKRTRRRVEASPWMDVGGV